MEESDTERACKQRISNAATVVLREMSAVDKLGARAARHAARGDGENRRDPGERGERSSGAHRYASSHHRRGEADAEAEAVRASSDGEVGASSSRRHATPGGGDRGGGSRRTPRSSDGRREGEMWQQREVRHAERRRRREAEKAATPGSEQRRSERSERSQHSSGHSSRRPGNPASDRKDRSHGKSSSSSRSAATAAGGGSGSRGLVLGRWRWWRAGPERRKAIAKARARTVAPEHRAEAKVSAAAQEAA